MDVKTRNYIIIIVGVVFLLLGAASSMAAPGLFNYITLLVGIILIILGAVGLKQGKVIG